MKYRTPNLALTLIAMLCLLSPATQAETAADYKIDPTHTFVQFRISHLGFSILNGRFNETEGHFFYDPGQADKSFINMKVNTASVDTNHAERDKHLRGDDFLEVEKFPVAEFSTTSYEEEGKTGTLAGNLTLHGVTKPIEIYVQHIGAGNDPWGGYRRGLKGQTSIQLKDFGIDYNLGPASEVMYLDIYVEGIRNY